MLRIDHVVMAVRDLDEAARRLAARHGLASTAGGRHVGLGTGNRIVPLGPDYVELIAVVDPAEALGNPLGRFVARRAGAGARFTGWCLSTDDVEAVAARLGVKATAMSRRRPDGAVLSWRLAGLDAAMADPSLPFFITWDVPPELHPGRTAAAHRIEPRGIAWIEVGADPDRLGRWVGREELPVRVVGGASGPQAVGIATAAGEVVLR